MLAVAGDDGDTSIIYAASGGALVLQLFAFPQILGVADPVNAASLSAVTRQALVGAGGRSYYMYWNSTQIVVNRAADVDAVKPNYSTITYTGAGATLGLAVVNGQHGFSFSAAGGPSNKAEYWVTHVYRTVNYTFSAGSAGEFAHLIGSLIGPLIGAGLLLRDMPALSRCLGRIRLRPDEYEAAWRDWQAYKHPVMAWR
jgi:hypothetical protein